MNKRGLYFVFEPGEYREGTKRLRVTYVGRTKTRRLWERLKKHSEDSDGSALLGNMFRATARREQPNSFDKWDKAAGWFDVDWVDINDDCDYEAMRQLEYTKLLKHVRDCSFTWVPNAGHLERHAISLLSNYKRPTVDPRSDNWLGLYSHKEEIRESGLWNHDHINDQWTDTWLDDFQGLVKE